MKKNRHEKILEVITKYQVGTQDDLIAYLREEGYDVTQATVSRDIHDLKLTKILTPEGGYRYVQPKPAETPMLNLHFSRTLAESIVSVDYSINIVVVKTYPGMSNAVAVNIDNMSLEGVLGCVAGDDTIFIVTHSQEISREISEKIKLMIQKL